MEPAAEAKLQSKYQLNIISTVHSAPYDIGTEGILTCFLCDDLTITPAPDEPQVLLVVFIGHKENFTLELVVSAPSTAEPSSTFLLKLLAELKSIYMGYSVVERNKCSLIN